jgi:hypothetical protein
MVRTMGIPRHIGPIVRMDCFIMPIKLWVPLRKAPLLWSPGEFPFLCNKSEIVLYLISYIVHTGHLPRNCRISYVNQLGRGLEPIWDEKQVRCEPCWIVLGGLDLASCPWPNCLWLRENFSIPGTYLMERIIQSLFSLSCGMAVRLNKS